MTVWVVYVPIDYDNAEIVGVFHNESDAIREAKNKKAEIRLLSNVRIVKVSTQ